MFTDTHCHMKMIKERGYDVQTLIQDIVHSNVPFVLDIGTEVHDLHEHVRFVQELIEENIVEELKKKALDIFYFSAGLWPSVDSILKRHQFVKDIENDILSLKATNKVCAIGECGLDRHWNKPNDQNLIEGYKANDILNGEEELFEMQIELARKLNLPVIVHSRDAALETFKCLKNVGWEKGIIHCYSYGPSEVKMFLDLGFYISLSGTVTYSKNVQLDNIKKLINYIPHDMLLLETDAPYLAPVPMRGKINTPILVKHIYDFVSNLMGLSNEELADIVLKNTQKVFMLT